MKIFSLFILVFSLTFLNINAQSTDDIYFKTEKSNSDSSNSIVNDLGMYFSAGFGRNYISSLPVNISELDVMGFIASASFAFKSHVASLTTTRSSSFNGGLESQSTFENSYLALLFGESFRQKNCFISLSIGIAESETSFLNNLGPHNFETYNFRGISYPIELKAFILANHVIGFGIHLYHNLDRKYSTSFISASIVFGSWNLY